MSWIKCKRTDVDNVIAIVDDGRLVRSPGERAVARSKLITKLDEMLIATHTKAYEKGMAAERSRVAHEWRERYYGDGV